MAGGEIKDAGIYDKPLTQIPSGIEEEGIVFPQVESLHSTGETTLVGKGTDRG